jgi:hypothetical protein
MSSAARRNDKDSTSSGHGALGMGGQPTDDPRDLNSGGGDDLQDDRGGGTGPVPGAGGNASFEASGSVAGVPGDKTVTERLTQKRRS